VAHLVLLANKVEPFFPPQLHLILRPKCRCPKDLFARPKGENGLHSRAWINLDPKAIDLYCGHAECDEKEAGSS
jgi:hypothetical protein